MPEIGQFVSHALVGKEVQRVEIIAQPDNEGEVAALRAQVEELKALLTANKPAEAPKSTSRKKAAPEPEPEPEPSDDDLDLPDLTVSNETE